MVAGKYIYKKRRTVQSVSGEIKQLPNDSVVRSSKDSQSTNEKDYRRRLKYWQPTIRQRPSEYANRFVSYDTAIAKQCLAELDKLDHLNDQTLLKNFVLFAAEVDQIVQTLSGLKDPFYLSDPRLAFKIVKRLNKHHQNGWYAYYRYAPDVPILVTLAKFLKGLVNNAHSFSRNLNRPARPPKPLVPEFSYRAKFELNELLRQSMKQLESLPRLESPAPAHQLVLFTVVLRGVISMLLAKNPSLLINQRLFDVVRDRLSPFYTWRWDVYAVKHHCEPADLVALDRFVTDEAARVSPSPPPSMFKPASTGGCLCCEGGHSTARCGLLRDMAVAERLRWACRAQVCQQCLAQHPGRCRAPRCSMPHCHRPHHILLHTRSSVLK